MPSREVEPITIPFNDGPVLLNGVVFSQIYSGEVAVINTAGYSASAGGRGHGFRRRSSNVRVGMGMEVTQFVVSTRGRFNDLSLSGLDFDVTLSIGGQPQLTPTQPIPEPHAALVFMVGMGLAATRLRRR